MKRYETPFVETVKCPLIDVLTASGEISGGGTTIPTVDGDTDLGIDIF
jgi:hypothetical protein